MDPAALDDICRRHRVLLLVQFGSTVSGAVHERSDLDLAALLEAVRRPATSGWICTSIWRGCSPGRTSIRPS